MTKTTKLMVNEIFLSLEGETTTAGLPSLFIRLTGCNLRCKYCDSKNSYFDGKEMTIDDIMNKVKDYTGNFHHITLTGGEPLLQDNASLLINHIIEENHNLQIETNGSMDISTISPKARRILDVKTPSSGEINSFLFSNIPHLTQNDEIKFVLSDMNDYNFAKNFIEINLKSTDAIINLSPTYKVFEAIELSQLILKDRLQVRLNLQLHKLLNFS